MRHRRYAPALIVAATLLLLVAIAPSRGAKPAGASAFPAFEGGTSQPSSPVGGAAGPAPGSSPQVPVSGTAAPGSTSSGRTSTGGGTGGAAATGGGGSQSSQVGDTKHCSGGKQFALAGFIAAPPCQPVFSGDNGGATYSGVTKDKITVVYYRLKASPAINAIVGSANVQPTDAQLSAFLKAETAFVNKRYELWGRKISFVDYQSSSCQGSPPNDDCFRQDARTIVSTYHPFVVLFPQNVVAPGFHDELTKAGVVNFGGGEYPSQFSTSRRPFHYDYTMDGDTQAVLAGELYCKQLANQPARYAGDAALRSKPRKAEILVPDNAQNVASAQHLQSLVNACDSGGATIKTYAQDTSQAASQSSTLASQAKQSGITTLLWFTDPALPVYLTPQLTSQNYFPENVLVGGSFLDYDSFGQLYDQRQWVNAFGLGNLPQSVPASQQDAQAAWRDGGGSGDVYATADGAQGYFSSLAAGLQQAGARLDPGTFERGMLTLPSWGGDKAHTLVQYGGGDYTGQSDARVTYWDPNATSPVNGKKGAYAPLEGGNRYRAGTFPKQPLAIPGRS